jgi:transposase
MVPADAGPEATKRILELEARVAELEDVVKRLLARIEELERAGKRQASPFAKGPPKENPKKPGRKPGADYGRHQRGVVPEKVDEEVRVPLPSCCPGCGGEIDFVSLARQFQVELPRVEPFSRRFDIEIGRCRRCGRRVQPRDPRQTSDAIGAAEVQVGPNALAQATLLAKSFAVPVRKVASFFERAFGFCVSASALCRANLRIADRLASTYTGLIERVAQSPVVYADETGWRTGGHKRWLWTFTTPQVTVYKIARSRGGDVVTDVLGSGFTGTLGRDGWSAYGAALENASFQSCLFHLLRRAREILKDAKRGAAKFPHAVTRVLKAAIRLGERREELTPHGFASLRGKIESRLDRLVNWSPSYGPNAKFAKHLRNERPHLLTFLHNPAVEATNWPAEQSIRPAVLARKISGGTRTDRGSDAHSILTSVLRTAGQQHLDAVDLLVEALHLGQPLEHDLVHVPSG